MQTQFVELIKKRRSVYNLGNQINVSRDYICQLIKEIVKYTPSAFNSQSTRVVLLFGKQNQKLWQITLNCLKNIVPAEKFATTEQKIASFAAGYGTILYFEDLETVQNLQKKYSLYKNNFLAWAQQSNAMLQFSVWTALAENGIGASLQHYNPLIDDSVKKEWNLPEQWSLIAQMPFGNIEQTPDEKTFLPLEERVLIKE